VTPSSEYTCSCPGFKSLKLEQMCVRCLATYAEGLPHALEGESLTLEMRRVAVCLKRVIEADPLLGEQYVHVGQSTALERN
jgi:hypothetical protein